MKRYNPIDALELLYASFKNCECQIILLAGQDRTKVEVRYFIFPMDDRQTYVFRFENIKDDNDLMEDNHQTAINQLHSLTEEKYRIPRH